MLSLEFWGAKKEAPEARKQEFVLSLEFFAAKWAFLGSPGGVLWGLKIGRLMPPTSSWGPPGRLQERHEVPRATLHGFLYVFAFFASILPRTFVLFQQVKYVVTMGLPPHLPHIKIAKTTGAPSKSSNPPSPEMPSKCFPSSL